MIYSGPALKMNGFIIKFDGDSVTYRNAVLFILIFIFRVLFI